MTSKEAPNLPSQGVQSLAKALDVLCCFSSEHSEWGVTELADYAGLCKSATHRILTTCVDYGFLEQAPSRKYRLGTQILDLANVCRFDRRLLWKADHTLHRLSEATRSIAHLAVLDGRDVLELMRSAGPQSILFTRSPRFRMPPHATALGKVLLAAGGEATFRRFIGSAQILRRYTAFTLVRPEQLKSELDAVFRKGYALSDQESVLGCRCLAVPVRGEGGEVIAAVSISSTVELISDAMVPDLLANLRAAAYRIAHGALAGVVPPGGTATGLR